LQGEQNPLPVKPPPIPTGVIPLPQGAPPTGQQAPVPAPAQPLPSAEKPLKTSPPLAAINHFVQNQAITLQDAVAIALYTNHDFATVVTALQRAQARTGQTRAQLNPTVGVNAEATEYDAATTANFGALLGGGQAGNNAAPSIFIITPQFNPIITTGFTLPLDISGSLHSAVSQAQFNEVAARIDVNRVRNQILYNVKTAFYNVLRAQAQVAVATDNLNNALNRLSDANKNYAAGTSPRFDVLSAQRDVADAQQALINARAQVSVNLAALKNTIGLDITTRLRISDRDAVQYPPGVTPPTVPPIGPNGQPLGAGGNANGAAPSEPPNAQNAPAASGMKITPLPLPRTDEVEDTFDFGPEYQTLLQEAVQTRPEILEADAQITAAQHGIEFARRSDLPSLSLSLSYVYTPNAAGFTRRSEGVATLGVTLPLYDGGLARERVREARTDVATAQINRRQAVDQVQVDVQQAYIALVQARDRVAVTNVELSEAREAFRLARVRYNAGVSQQPGVSPQLELSNSQTTLTQAQTNQVNALYDYNNARAQLDRAVGRYSYTGTGPGYTTSPKSLSH
jgi:outer membrane protein TolC